MNNEPGVPLLTEKLKSLIGAESEPSYFLVEKGAIQKVLKVLQDTNPMWKELETAKIGTEVAVPPAYFMGIRPTGLKVEIDVPLPRTVAGGEEWQFFSPLRLTLGQTVVTRRRLSDITEKQGKSGPMILIVFEDSYETEAGQTLALRRMTTIRM